MIKRFFSTFELLRIQKDFAFLLKNIGNSFGEIDLSIRDGYFNLYYKGNSLAKIIFGKGDNYEVKIHSKFFLNTPADDVNLYNSSKMQGDYCLINLSAKQLHPFLQKKHLTKFASRIKLVNNGEEIGFEQALITDNINNENFIIIDRQITDSDLKGKRLDLLALKYLEGNKFQFVVVEVKLGNNPELKEEVAKQLDVYINHINNHFKEYKSCYEQNYAQKRILDLIKKPIFPNIEIVLPVKGLVVVGGYSGLANKQLTILKQNHPGLDITHFEYVLKNP